jgi:hypothetical protein
MRGGVWSKELGSPTWKPLGRRSVEVLVGYPVSGSLTVAQQKHTMYNKCARTE